MSEMSDKLTRDLASYQVTNSEFAQKLGSSHSKIERRVRELLRPDPKARMQSGYTRKYSLNEAFTVYIGGTWSPSSSSLSISRKG